MIATRVRQTSRTSPHSPLRLDRSRDIRRSVAARDISRSAPGVVLDLRDVDLLDTDGVITILEAARRIRRVADQSAFITSQSKCVGDWNSLASIASSSRLHWRATMALPETREPVADTDLGAGSCRAAADSRGQGPEVTEMVDGGREENHAPLHMGLDTFGDLTHDQDDQPLSQAQTIRNVVEQGVLAERVGVDSFGIGEHHTSDFPMPAAERRLGRYRLSHTSHSPRLCGHCSEL